MIHFDLFKHRSSRASGTVRPVRVSSIEKIIAITDILKRYTILGVEREREKKRMVESVKKKHWR